MDTSWALIIFGAILLGGYLLYAGMTGQIKSMEKRIKTMEATIRQFTADGEVTEPAVNDELRKLVAQGKNVEAIKQAREAFGLSLLEAKQYVDSL